MQLFRNSLPCYKMRTEILQKMTDNQVLVISGETGCGKTTQVPQYILEAAGLAGEASKVSLVCTQPRRVAAITVAGRVGTEMEDRDNSVVGYQVRLDRKVPRSQGSILYCTTGVLLQKLKSDSQLRQFTHIVIDEIHERDVMADLLLVLIRNILPLRPELKLILMSATLNASKFSSYMGNCETLHIPGFMFPVKKYYLEDVLELTQWESVEWEGEEVKPENRISEEEVEKLVEKKRLAPKTVENLLRFDAETLNLELVASLVKFIHEEKPPGAILVFLPGWEEISFLHDILSCDLTEVFVLPLHSSMPHHEQKKIFEVPHGGRRKIVIATNIAESSVTINDIVYVVDSGKAKMKSFDSENNVARLQVEWISQANAKQRMGRAGRLRKGEVFKLYTQHKEDRLSEFMVPEITRCRLENIILRLKVLEQDVKQVFSQLMDCPSARSVELAEEILLDIGAVTESLQLTGLGWTLGQLPIDPQLGKMLVLGCVFSCLDPVLSVVSCLEYKSPFIVTSKTRDQMAAMDMLASNTLSDHLTIANILSVFDGFDAKAGQARTNAVQEFCYQNFLSQGVLRTIQRNKVQFCSELYKLGLVSSSDPMARECNQNSGCEGLVRALVSLGLLPNILNIAEEEDGTVRLHSMNSKDLAFHPKSCNRDLIKKLSNKSFLSSMPRWFTYYEKIDTSNMFISDSTAVSHFVLLLLASNLTFETHPDPSSDASIDPNTKSQLGVLFPNDQIKISCAMIGSGKSKMRLLLCDEETRRQISAVRSVLTRTIQQKCTKGRKWELESGEGKILGALAWCIVNDK